jgi:FkbM family methyltransferase
MTMISYAQAREDVLLWRCLTHVSHDVGFYIDVGANDPEIDSVTKIWYDYGWRGINLEPSPAWFERLQRERPRDINIQAAVTDTPGHVTFHDIDGHQLGTVVEAFADRHAAAGMIKNSYTVEAVTLTDICERFAPAQIHFLKVDVEGHEGAVLRGMDFTRFRPWVLVIEATEPNRLDVPTHAEWDQLVCGAGYTFAHTDVLNRYYVAHEHPELLGAFALPADDYVRAHELRRIAALEAELLEARKQITTLRGA